MLKKKWVTDTGNGEALETSGCSSRDAADLSAVSLAETGRASYELLRSLAGRYTKGVNRMSLLMIGREGLVSILHSLF